MQLVGIVKEETTVTFDKQSILETILNVLDKCKKEKGYLDKISYNSNASPICQYILEHFLEINNLEELTSYYGVSKSYICRLFKKHTGMTIFEYINNIKIQYAEKLLQETELTIGEIGCMSGFQSVIYFDRVFKKVCGEKPKEYQKRINKQFVFLDEREEKKGHGK